jgi:hypothetical protein
MPSSRCRRVGSAMASPSSTSRIPPGEEGAGHDLQARRLGEGGEDDHQRDAEPHPQLGRPGREPAEGAARCAAARR